MPRPAVGSCWDLVVPSSYHLSRGDPDHLEPLHHRLLGNYIPPGVVEMKIGELMKLSLGTKSVKEYLHAFNNLSRYAPEFVKIEAKKIASFHRGLSPKMLKTMGTGTRATFNAYISVCLTQENNNNNYSASKSRKKAFEAGLSQSRAPVAGRQQYRPPTPGARF